jgi:uncharacterized protein (TIGR03790 family)
MRRTLFLLAAWWIGTLPAPAERENQVVILANRNLPASMELARYYQAVRQIPEDRICALDLPDAEVISRRDYDRRLRDPLIAFLRERQLITTAPAAGPSDGKSALAWKTERTRVRYLVSMYGVPLRIADTVPTLAAKLINHMSAPRLTDGAAVDSELGLLLHPGYPLEGPYPNPFFNQHLAPDRVPDTFLALIAGRLDGPDPESVRTALDGALQAERYGLAGRAYFDSRGWAGDDYAKGDYWIREAGERFRREGYDCAEDAEDECFSEFYPMEQAAIYLGWYAEHLTGPFTRPGFRFAPGAVACHIHSGSAKTLRSRTEFWAGPFVARGAAFTVGAVHEPFLDMTPQWHTFAARLCSGLTVAESAVLATSHLSWQITLVGDPLYRPFRYSLEEQIAHLEVDGRTEREWAHLRRLNQMVRAGRSGEAVAYAGRKIDDYGSLVLQEWLGGLLALNGETAEAARQFQVVVALAPTAETTVRAGAEYMAMYYRIGQAHRIESIKRRIIDRWPDHPVLPWLDHAYVPDRN